MPSRQGRRPSLRQDFYKPQRRFSDTLAVKFGRPPPALQWRAFPDTLLEPTFHVQPARWWDSPDNTFNSWHANVAGPSHFYSSHAGRFPTHRDAPPLLPYQDHGFPMNLRCPNTLDHLFPFNPSEPLSNGFNDLGYVHGHHCGDDSNTSNNVDSFWNNKNITDPAHNELLKKDAVSDILYGINPMLDVVVDEEDRSLSKSQSTYSSPLASEEASSNITTPTLPTSTRPKPRRGSRSRRPFTCGICGEKIKQAARLR